MVDLYVTRRNSGRSHSRGARFRRCIVAFKLAERNRGGLISCYRYRGLVEGKRLPETVRVRHPRRFLERPHFGRLGPGAAHRALR